jgi:hypothetical protein
MIDREALLTEYLNAVSSKARIECLPDGAVVATAELLSDGTRATVWVRWLVSDISVHDNGYCTDHLASLDFNIYGSDQRRDTVERVCRGYGVKMERGVLGATCSMDDLGPTMLRVAGAIHTMADLIYTKQAYHEPSSLRADVEAFLRTRVRLPLDHNPVIQGKLARHRVDLAVLNGRRDYVRIISGADITMMVYHWVFTFCDVRKVDADSRLFVLCDPQRDRWLERTRSILSDYSDGSFSWDDRERFAGSLTEDATTPPGP